MKWILFVPAILAAVFLLPLMFPALHHPVSEHLTFTAGSGQVLALTWVHVIIAAMIVAVIKIK